MKVDCITDFRITEPVIRERNSSYDDRRQLVARQEVHDPRVKVVSPVPELTYWDVKRLRVEAVPVLELPYLRPHLHRHDIPP